MQTISLCTIKVKLKVLKSDSNLAQLEALLILNDVSGGFSVINFKKAPTACMKHWKTEYMFFGNIFRHRRKFTEKINLW